MRVLLAVIFGVCFLSACGQAELKDQHDASQNTVPDNTKTEPVNPDAVPHAMLGDNVIPESYQISLRMNPDDDGYSGLVDIAVTIKEPTQKIWLHGKNMTVTNPVSKSANAGIIPLTFTELPASEAPSGIAYLESPLPLPAGKHVLSLPFETPFNLNLDSAYKVVRGDDAYVVTQFEPLGAREAFPSFDEPRFKVPFTLSITAPEEDFVYANTPVIAKLSDGSGWVRHEFATTKPLPTYLIAFGAGPYDVVEYADLPATQLRKRPIKLRGVAARGEGKNFEYALANTAGILEAIENYFGIPYPYEKIDLIAAPDYAFGAMENPGAIVYREYLLLMDETAPLSQKRAYARVHSHELAHQWFGNLVTPYWWEDIWLNEAFATWMGNKGTTLWQPEGHYDRNTLKSALGAMNIDSLSTTRKVREPLDRSENVMLQFDGITYRKGGGVLSMFESYLGEEAFQKGVRLHMERFEHDVASADDFFQSLADGSENPEVVSAMKSFVDQAGLPLVTAQASCMDDNKTTVVNLTQSRYAPLGSKTRQGQQWRIPVCVKFGTGDDIEKSCTLLDPIENNQKFFITQDGKTCADYIMPNENGSGYYRFTMDSAGWNSLLSNIDKLNTREVLAMQDSLLAAYRAGEVESSVYLKGVEVLAAHPEYDVVNKAGDLLGWMGNHLPDDAMPAYQEFVSDLYVDRFIKIVGTDSMEGQLLAPALLSNLIYRAKNTKIIDTYSAKGAAYLGLDGDADKSAVASNLLSSSLGAAVMRRENSAFEPLLEIAKNGSPLEKSAALSALTDVEDTALAAKLLDMALDENGPFTGRQSTSIVFGLIGHDKHGKATWQWLKDNFDEYVEKRVPSVRASGMAGYASGFCSADERNEVETFFNSKADIIPGYERRLAQTLESIELCAALKAEKSNELAKALMAD